MGFLEKGMRRFYKGEDCELLWPETGWKVADIFPNPTYSYNSTLTRLPLRMVVRFTLLNYEVGVELINDTV